MSEYQIKQKECTPPRHIQEKPQLKVGDQVIATGGFAFLTNEPQPGDRGIVTLVGGKMRPENVMVNFFGFDKSYEFSPVYLQKIMPSQPVAKDYYARTKERAREWLFKHGYHNRGNTSALIMDNTVFGYSTNGPSVLLEELLCTYMMDLEAGFDPTECEPSLRWQIEHLEGCLKIYKEKYEKFKNAGIVEIAVENQNVSDYIEHWEGRALKAEEELEHRTRQNQANVGYLKERDEEIKALNMKYRLAHENAKCISKTLSEEIEKLQVQLAGVSVAACGGTNHPAKQGDYGWSVAYQDVLDLRRNFDAAVKRSAQRSKWLNDAAAVLDCDLDSIASAITKLKASIPPTENPKTIKVNGVDFYTKNCDFSPEATAQLLSYLGALFNEIHAGIGARGTKNLVQAHVGLDGKTIRNLQRAWRRSCFREQAKDWE